MGSPKLAAHEGPPPDHQEYYGEKGKAAEDGYGESERSRIDNEFCAINSVFDGGYRPGNTNAQENIDSVASRDVTD